MIEIKKNTLTAWVTTWDCDVIVGKMKTCKISLTAKDMESYGAGYTKEEFMQHVTRWGYRLSRTLEVPSWDRGLRIPSY